MKKYFVGMLLVCVGGIPGWSQQLPFFTHHVLNPYIYNPAFAGYDQSATFYLTHRQQWLGVEGAPASTHLSFHTPAGNRNPISLGADVLHDRIGVLRHSNVRATIAYMIPLSAEKEHYLKAGFSAGVGLHQYDLSGPNVTSDAVILRASNNSTFLDGRFGVQYHYENLNIGLALPHLLTPPAANPDGFSNVAFDQFSRAIASVNYRFNLGVESNLAFVPTLLYNFSQTSESQAEAIGLLEFHRSFWVGGSYQQALGFGGLVGFKMKNLKFSYHYGTGGSELSQYAGGTHEAQLGFTIGKKKVMVKRKPRLTTQTDADAIPEATIKKGRRRKKKEEEIPDRKKLPSQREPQETFNDDSFEKVEQGIILIPSEEEANPGVVDPVAPNDAPSLPNESNNTAPGADVPGVDAPGVDAPGVTESRETLSPSSPGQEPEASDNPSETAEEDAISWDTPGVDTPGVDTPGVDVPNVNSVSDDPPASADNVWEGNDEVDPWQGLEDEQTATPPPSFDESAERAITKVKTVSSDHPLEMPGGTYIIAGTFSQRPNADRLAQQLAQQGFGTQVGYNTAKGYYYVSLFESDDLDDVKKRLYRVRGNESLKKAWILVIE